MIIRKATETDLEKILELNKNLFVFEAKFTDKYNQDWTFSEIGKNYFKERLNNENCILLVAEENQVIGYSLTFIKSAPFWKINPVAELENMFVEEKFRDKGVGSALVQETINELNKRGINRLRVGAIYDNTNAINFYKKNGFEPVNLYLEKSL